MNFDLITFLETKRFDYRDGEANCRLLPHFATRMLVTPFDRHRAMNIGLSCPRGKPSRCRCGVMGDGRTHL